MTRPGGGPMGGMPPQQRARSFGPTTRRMLRRLASRPLSIAVVLLCTLGSVILTAVSPRILGHATDLIFAGVIGRSLPDGLTKAEAVARLRARGDGTFADLVSSMNVTPGVGVDFSAVGRTLSLALALYVVAAFLAWTMSYVLNLTVQSTVREMRREVEDTIHRLPLRYFDSTPRGELLSRVTNDIDNVSQSMQQTISQLLNSLLTVVAVLAMMIVVSPLLSLIAVATVPLAILATTVVARRSKPHFTTQWASTGALNAQVEEAFTGHEVITVFGRGQQVQDEFDDRNESLYSASWRAQFISGIIMPAIMFLGNLNFVAIAVVGGLRVASGALSLGEVQAFVQYSRQFTQPLTQIGAMFNLLQSGVASAERIFDVLDEERESPDPHDTTDPSHVAVRGKQVDSGAVTFDHVAFRYDEDRPLISDLSLHAQPGQMVAIVGPTGAGKTTVVNLLMRFYDIDSGAITVDGVDTRAMSRGRLRSATGMVLQDSWLFGGTIYDNIAYGNPSARREEVLAAARASYVDRFVTSLPDGYETVIDEEGGGVSAGEKQLITIARAFLARPRLLILDEATSSVDTRTELLIQQAMIALRAERTSFVIAHRLSTIRDADVILVMEDGRIVQQGAHDELIEVEGSYRRLYASQFVGPLDDVDAETVADRRAEAGSR